MGHKTEIKNLIYLYAQCIDKGEFGRIAELFKDGSIIDSNYQELAKGSKQVFEFYNKLIRIYPDTQTPKTEHLVTDIVVSDINTSNFIKATSNFEVMQENEKAEIATIITGTYNSDFKKINSQWCLTDIKFLPTMTEDTGRHLLMNINEINTIEIIEFD